MSLKMSAKQSMKMWCLYAAVLCALILASPSQGTAEEFAPATIRLFTAVQKNDMDLAKAALKEGGNLYAYNAQGRTPVDLALDLGHFYLVKYLVRERNKLDKSGLARPVRTDQKPVKPTSMIKSSITGPIMTGPIMTGPIMIEGVAELPKPPAYPPSKPRPVVVKRVAPQPQVAWQPQIQPVVAPTPMLSPTLMPTATPTPTPNMAILSEPTFKPIEILPVEGLPFERGISAAALPNMRVPDLTVIQPVLQPSPMPKVEPEPIDEPLPFVAFAPDTKRKPKPVRTFFLKAMDDHVPKDPVRTKAKKTVALDPKQKIQRSSIPWGSVKPAEHVMDAPDFPTPRRRLTKSRVDAVKVDPAAPTIKCKDYTSPDNVKNTSSSITLDLPPLRADVKCDP